MKFPDIMKDYEPLIIPLKKPIEELTKKEAQEYFVWFTSNIDSRVAYLTEKVSLDSGVSSEQLQFTEESLIIIWRWFLQKAKISRTPRRIIREMKQSMHGSPKSWISHVVNQNKEELSIFTQYLIRDIGMYLGKMFVQNHSIIKWSYKTSPKNYISVNEPLLIGFIDDNPDYPRPFYPDFEPIGAVECVALNLFDGNENENDLLYLYQSMLPFIPN